MLSTLFESNRFSQLFFGFTGPNDDWDRLNEDLFFEIIGIIIKSKSSYAINTTLEKIETHYNGELPSNLKLKVKNIIEECHINADELNLTEKARRQYYNILGIVDTENSNDNFSYSSF
ncbi:MAG: hypothetical protein HWD59_03645 [Coxiellaceae bacterium]|nr:MAG: hypothetical protein HWD59_03645 [Coxiellaceae bacterium]